MRCVTKVRNCGQQCFNHTPTDVVGICRGIEIQKGFEMGEVDYKLTTDGLEIKNQKGEVSRAKVATHPGQLWFTSTDGENSGKVIKAIMSDMNKAGAETKTIAFALGSPGGEVPDSAAADMTLGDGAKVKAGVCEFYSVSPIWRKHTEIRM
jgi:hypothetical protein